MRKSGHERSDGSTCCFCTCCCWLLLPQALPAHNGEVLALAPAGGRFLVSGGADFQVGSCAVLCGCALRGSCSCAQPATCVPA